VACGDRVRPGTTADTTRQYIAGLRSYRIDGEPVSEEEFRQALDAARRMSDA
jgi:hypothetical protein